MTSPRPSQDVTCGQSEIIICRGRDGCGGVESWPCPLCFCVDIGESWLIGEILANLPRGPATKGPSKSMPDDERVTAFRLILSYDHYAR
jgi:hypothetical protein